MLALSDAQSPLQPCCEMVVRLAHRVLQIEFVMPQHISNICWAIARLNVLERSILHVLLGRFSEYAASLPFDTFKKHEMSSLMWAFSHCNYMDDSVKVLMQRCQTNGIMLRFQYRWNHV